jgi:hypothetical protein
VKTVIYTGPGHVLVAGPHRIRRGTPAQISDKLFEQLQRDPSMTLQVVADEPEPAQAADEADDYPASLADEYADHGEEELTTHG